MPLRPMDLTPCGSWACGNVVLPELEVLTDSRGIALIAVPIRALCIGLHRYVP